MKRIDADYLVPAKLHLNNLDLEFREPGSMILLGIVIGAFSVYGIAATSLMAVDIFSKIFG